MSKASVSNTGALKGKKTYHKKVSGNALTTADNHAQEHELQLYGSCFCPFVQRVWISLEAKKLPYQYIEVDPYAKPAALMALNPRGLVPALKHKDWSTHESSVIMEYLEDAFPSSSSLLSPPSQPQARAHARLWTDHINRHIVPGFYHLLQAQDIDAQVNHAQSLKEHLATLIAAADPEGPFFAGSQLGFVDAQLAPWLLRFSRVMAPYRAWPPPEAGSRWERWVRAVEECAAVKATTSEDKLYLESYERYAENRPGTSQLADAVNSGCGLP